MVTPDTDTAAAASIPALSVAHVAADNIALASCEICTNYFATDYSHNDCPDEKRRKRVPLQSHACSHVLCYPCVEELITRQSNGTQVRVFVDCPWCLAKRAFSLRQGQVSLATCAISASVQAELAVADAVGTSTNLDPQQVLLQERESAVKVVASVGHHQFHERQLLAADGDADADCDRHQMQRSQVKVVTPAALSERPTRARKNPILLTEEKTTSPRRRKQTRLLINDMNASYEQFGGGSTKSYDEPLLGRTPPIRQETKALRSSSSRSQQTPPYPISVRRNTAKNSSQQVIALGTRNKNKRNPETAHQGSPPPPRSATRAKKQRTGSPAALEVSTVDNNHVGRIVQINMDRPLEVRQSQSGVQDGGFYYSYLDEEVFVWSEAS